MLTEDQQTFARRHVQEAERQITTRITELDHLLKDRSRLDATTRRENERIRLVSLRYELHEALALL